jgi:hypothetical protein
MNFSDFGIKDESELEQDEFSLGRPTFGKENQLTVIGWKGRSGANKYYIVKCSECSKDPELFGDGIFRIVKGGLNSGRLPCGCSNSVRWSKDQYEIKVKRDCGVKGYLFHGFSGDYKGIYTKLKLECPKHGVWESTVIDSFLRGGGCPVCKIDKIKITHTLENYQHISKFMSTGKLKEGTKFWKSERVNSQGVKVYWNYTCPVCSNDEYVKAGVCSGIFETFYGELQRGILSCRCSLKFHWKQEQYEYRIKKKMQESKTPDEFVGFVDGFKNRRSKFTRFCKVHGSYDTRVSNYLNSNHSCPLCGSHSQKECYINFIKDKESTVALKFGIAKDSEERIKSQNRESIFDVEQYGIWIFPDVKSCKAAEKFIKQNLPCRFLTKSDMHDGFTETTSVENLETIIKIYEDFGGARKFINAS